MECLQLKPCGVPQVYILGHLLFLIHICYSWLVNITTAVLFADDIDSFQSGTDINAMNCDINNELRNIAVWLKVY